MPERYGFSPDQQPKIIEFPYQLRSPESFDLAYELLKDKRVSDHLNFLEKHHPPSFQHSVRVGALSADLCLENDYKEEETLIVTIGGMLHDIGKCVIPQEILNKTSPLSPEEWKIMKTHAREGFERLKDPAYDGIREIVREHHEYQGENSYPRKNGNGKSEDHAVERRTNDPKKFGYRAALVAAADHFDALCVQRPYNPKFDKNEISRLLRDPHIYSGDPKFIEQILTRYEDT